MEKRIKFIDFIDRIQRQDKYITELEEENKTMKEILHRIKELYEDEEEAELLIYLDKILDDF